MNKRNYIATQMAVLFIPAMLATAILDINHCITNPIEELAGYLCGVSGLIFMFVLHYSGLNEVICSSILLALYVIVAPFVFYRNYSKGTSTVTFAIGINCCFSIWSVAFGAWWMLSAMQ